MLRRVTNFPKAFPKTSSRFSKTLPFQKPGQPAPTGIPSFLNYRFIPPLEHYIFSKSLLTPSPIQQLAFRHFQQQSLGKRQPVFLGGPTGSGKTLAYLLPIIDALKRDEQKSERIARIPNRPRAVVLAPSKELISQIYDVAKEISHSAKLKVEKVDGASNWARTVRDIGEGVDILVTNVHKFERLTSERRVLASALKFLVIDEADVFIENGSEREMAKYAKNFYLLNNSESEDPVQMIYVSATLTNSLRVFLETVFDREVKFLLTSDTHFNLANLRHTFLPVLGQNRLELLHAELTRLFKKTPAGFFLVFCNSVAAVRAVDYYLKGQGVNCRSLHSDMPVRLRAESHRDFREKKVGVLVCSDLAARGLDFPHLSGVLNFDFPKNANDYLHRAGRAGRIGNLGEVVNLYQNRDLPMIRSMEESYRNRVPLEIGQSSYALKNKEDGKGELGRRAKRESSLPSEFVEFRKSHNSAYPVKLDGRGKRERQRREVRRPRDVLRQNVRSIKKSLKTQIKNGGSSKRIVFLKRELKRIHKRRLGIIGGKSNNR